jgi:hypothetical protein
MVIYEKLASLRHTQEIILIRFSGWRSMPKSQDGCCRWWNEWLSDTKPSASGRMILIETATKIFVTQKTSSNLKLMNHSVHWHYEMMYHNEWNLSIGLYLFMVHSCFMLQYILIMIASKIGTTKRIKIETLILILCTLEGLCCSFCRDV